MKNNDRMTAKEFWQVMDKAFPVTAPNNRNYEALLNHLSIMFDESAEGARLKAKEKQTEEEQNIYNKYSEVQTYYGHKIYEALKGRGYFDN